ncbi:Aste57867_2925 [Aphanomyces stellatus]|uniref:Aste57867_2925 protein n=1 Tax=Aphanomyces stellatus TaxID=120398 RepID=A0A485K9B5_9STRA|nr:hypothetical protein As57867_002917 [Aphanomyces stellatus]VFT80108.1 Aste57867_2925 [Aphanomyces stellatus]
MQRTIHSTFTRAMTTAPSKLEMLVLGSGPSTSVPSIRCLLTNPTCTVCPEAQANPASRNRRGNPSLFVKHEGVHILIDCGKTFRESVLRCLPQHNVHPVDAVVLTHGHADACFGLDDLRDVQRKASTSTPSLEALPIHCSHRTRAEIEGKFDYLFASSPAPTTALWTAKLQWCEFADMDTFVVRDRVSVRALPVWHGRDYIANGFEFGGEIGRRVVYISDVSAIPDETMAYLHAGAAIDVLFIDALHLDQRHGTHMNLPEALAAIRALQPTKTFLVGMGHSFDYAVHQASLREMADGIDVEMAYDGLAITLEEEARERDLM